MPKRNVLWMLAVAVVAVVVALLMRPKQTLRQGQVSTDAMVEALDKIIGEYYKPVDSLELQRVAVAAMVKTLDRHSRYYPYEKAQAFQKLMKGRLHGTGLVLGLSDRGPVVESVYPKSPADKGGLVPGDIILVMNEAPAFSMGVEEASAALSGGDDGKVRLSVAPGDKPSESRDVVLTPGEYPVADVTGLHRDSRKKWVYALNPDTGLAYIRVSVFVPGTVERFKKALRNTSQLRGLVLDLRSNPGGYLSEAVEMANLFLDDGPIVTVIRNKPSPDKYMAHSHGTYPDSIPIVVLMDSNSASASEIVAGALSQSDRAILVGTPSRGKHSVQTPLLLDDKLGLLHLTTAKFFFPSGAPEPTTKPEKAKLPDYAGKPIQPHVPMAVDPDRARRIRLLRKRMFGSVMPTTMPAGLIGQEFVREFIDNDAMLKEAIELLGDSGRRAKLLKDRAEARKKLLDTRPSGKGGAGNP